MNNRDIRIIHKIISEIELIEMLVIGFEEEQFSADERTKRAVCMTVINIGELVKNLTDEFKSANKDIPWRSIAGLRDIMAHKYQTLKMGDLWYTVQYDIPQLKIYIMKFFDEREI